MAGNHTGTTNFNKHVLTDDLGLIQNRNTTIFGKSGFFVLSPSVQNESLWFDLRDINLSKWNRKADKGYLVIRLFDEFILCDLDLFCKKLISEHNSVVTNNSGKHWKFLVKKRAGEDIVIINQSDKTLEFKGKAVSLEDMKRVFF
jgi:hypothetical protein